MGVYSLFHWLIVLFIISVVVPVGRILRRTGHNPAWALLFFFPLANFIALWVFAFKPWPIVDTTKP
jgi:hypothetical protein